MLDAHVVASIDDLELSARLIVEGLRSGGNRSPFHGYTTEFRQHRVYRAGDDLKYLDWKLFARTDRLYTRQFRETTNVPVMLVLDATASMAFPDGEGTGPTISKFRYASLVTAALAWLASDQGNAVGLMTLDDGNLEYLPPRGGRQHLRTILATLDSLKPSASWSPAQVIDRAAQLMRRKGIVVMLSDFYDDEDGASAALRRMTRHGHDVSVIQVLAREEVRLEEQGQVQFVDSETGEKRIVDASSIADEYAAAMNAFTRRAREEALHAGMVHALFTTDVPPERALRDFLLRRSALASADAAHRSVAR